MFCVMGVRHKVTSVFFTFKGKKTTFFLAFQDLASLEKLLKIKNKTFFNSSKFENLRNPSKNQRKNA